MKPMNTDKQRAQNRNQVFVILRVFASSKVLLDFNSGSAFCEVCRSFAQPDIESHPAALTE